MVWSRVIEVRDIVGVRSGIPLRVRMPVLVIAPDGSSYALALALC